MRRISSFVLFPLPLFAQDDALVGTWETSFTEPEVGDVTIRLSFGGDGGFQLDQVISASDDFLSEAGDAVPPIEEVTAQGTGTYRVDGDSLFAELTEVSMYVDGRDFLEVMTEVVRALARVAADLGGSPMRITRRWSRPRSRSSSPSSTRKRSSSVISPGASAPTASTATPCRSPPSQMARPTP